MTPTREERKEVILRQRLAVMNGEHIHQSKEYKSTSEGERLLIKNMGNRYGPLTGISPIETVHPIDGSPEFQIRMVSFGRTSTSYSPAKVKHDGTYERG